MNPCDFLNSAEIIRDRGSALGPFIGGGVDPLLPIEQDVRQFDPLRIDDIHAADLFIGPDEIIEGPDGGSQLGTVRFDLRFGSPGGLCGRPQLGQYRAERIRHLTGRHLGVVEPQSCVRRRQADRFGTDDEHACVGA